MLFKEQIPDHSFIKWLFSIKENRLLLMGSAGIIVIQFIWLKIEYPLPNLFPDSYEYIGSAISNVEIFSRPIGYIKFLQLFRLITCSHLLLILFQYIFLQASLLYLLFTVSYLLQPGKWLFRVLVFSATLNPLMFHLSNLIGSDPLFTALSLLWLTQLLWIISRPINRILITHAIILFLAFTVRYNAIYYPAISISITLFCKTNWRFKAISIVLIGILLGWYVAFTKYQFKKATGISQLAPFSGWQLAANALAAYTHAPKLDEPGTVPAQFRELHAIVNNYLTSTNESRHASNIQSVIYYLWMDNSPLNQYMRKDWGKASNTNRITQWSKMAPLYRDYGSYLIQRHPDLYSKYYLIPNLREYFKPFTEYVGMYNVVGKKILPSAIHWFNLKPDERNSDLNATEINTIKFSSAFNAIINIMFVSGFILFIVQAGYKKNNPLCNRILMCILSIWLFNLGFSVIASPISLRFQVFQLITTFIFSLALLQINIRMFMNNYQFRQQILKVSAV